MARPISQRRARILLTGLLLVALTLRALTPAGFMPSGHGPFSLMICHAALMAHDHAGGHPDDPKHSDQCPFGAAPAPGPISDLAALIPVALVGARIQAGFDSLQISARRERAHPARAPPPSLLRA